jgi:hypothetical protein
VHPGGMYSRSTTLHTLAAECTSVAKRLRMSALSIESIWQCVAAMCVDWRRWPTSMLWPRQPSHLQHIQRQRHQ